VTGIPLYAGRDWAVSDRSTLAVRAALEAGGAVVGTAVVLSVGWVRSRRL
jgi:tryptophan synthase alpha subunit